MGIFLILNSLPERIRARNEIRMQLELRKYSGPYFLVLYTLCIYEYVIFIERTYPYYRSLFDDIIQEFEMNSHSDSLYAPYGQASAHEFKDLLADRQFKAHAFVIALLTAVILRICRKHCLYLRFGQSETRFCDHT